ncbi:ABC transporter permease, partial [Pseudomonas sp. MWU12-2534b]
MPAGRQPRLPPREAGTARRGTALASLLGVQPSDAVLPNLTLDASARPSTLPSAIPSTLARERTDIRAAEAVLHQASANVGVATANLYPRVSISAGIGSERTRIPELVSGLNVWNVGLGLTQPIFHGGKTGAEKRSGGAANDAA